jgi:hypothetical protein
MSNNIFVWILIFVSTCKAQDWETIPKWTDVYIRGSQGFKNLDYKLGFLMDKY